MTDRSARRTKTEWAEIIAEYQRSGMDAKAFCETKQITLITFNKWIDYVIQSRCHALMLNRRSRESLASNPLRSRCLQ